MAHASVAVATTVIVLALALIGYPHAPVEGQTTPASARAVSSEKGGQDVFGAYDAAAWPKPLTMLPGHAGWTWGAGQYVFAESPNRVFVPAARRASGRRTARSSRFGFRRSGPSIEFPMFDCPCEMRRARAPRGSSSGRTARRPVTISTPGSQVSTTAGSTSSPSWDAQGI
jgi:hypothetical protein